MMEKTFQGYCVRCPLCHTVFEAREQAAGDLLTAHAAEDDLPLLPLADEEDTPDPPPKEPFALEEVIETQRS